MTNTQWGIEVDANHRKWHMLGMIDKADSLYLMGIIDYLTNAYIRSVLELEYQMMKKARQIEWSEEIE